ncbi:AMP-binding protein, partial [Nocardia sp. NPDC003054]
MNTVSVTANGFVPSDSSSLYEIVSEAARRDPARHSLCAVDGTQLTTGDLDTRVRALASALLDRAVAAGDRVAVLGRTSLEWALLDCAAVAIGAVIVPVYPTSSPAQIEHILRDSGSRFFAAETADDAVRLTSAGADGEVWSFDELGAWSTLGAEHPELDARLAAVGAGDLAMIVYTSGTTGLAKGCMISHRNMYVTAANTARQTGTLFDGTTALALPLSHVFGQTILFACLYGGSRTHLLPGVPDLVPALSRLRPTFLALVPYALEKIRKHTRALLTEEQEAAAVERGLAVLAEGSGPTPAGDAGGAAVGGALGQVICGGA